MCVRGLYHHFHSSSFSHHTRGLGLFPGTMYGGITLVTWLLGHLLFLFTFGTTNRWGHNTMGGYGVIWGVYNGQLTTWFTYLHAPFFSYVWATFGCRFHQNENGKITLPSSMGMGGVVGHEVTLYFGGTTRRGVMVFTTCSHRGSSTLTTIGRASFYYGGMNNSKGVFTFRRMLRYFFSF